MVVGSSPVAIGNFKGKVFHKKQKPNIVTYRNYKQLFNEAFTFDVKNSIIQMTFENHNLEFDRFKAALNEAIQRHAPLEKRSNKPSAFHE